MSLYTKAGKFTTNTTTGNQAITGLGFLPKLVMFMSIGDQSTTNSSRSYFGAATGSAARFACSQNDKTNVSTSTSMTGFATTRCLQAFTDGTATVLFDLDFVSMDADGFTVNNTTAAASGKDVYYLAMGGNDLTAAVGTFNTPTTLIAQSITGLGFQPNALMIYGGLRSNAAGTDITMGRQNIGMATSSAADHQLSAAIFETDNVTTSSCNRMWETNRIILTVNAAFATLDEASFTSFDAGGFTYTMNTDSGTSCIHGYIAIKAPRATAWWGFTGTDGSTGTYNVDPTTGFQPQAILTMGNGTVGINGWGHAILNQSWATATASVDATQSAGLSTCSSNGTTGEQAGAKINSGKFIETGFSSNATTWADEIVGTLTAINSTSFNTVNSTWDGTAREFAFLSIGGTQNANPNSINTSEGFGQPTVILGAIVSPSSIGSSEGFGQPSVILGSIVSPSSIGSSEGFGQPTVNLTLSISPISIGSGEGFGQPAVAAKATVAPNPVTTSEGWGSPSLAIGPINIHPTAIGSGEGFGQPAVTTPAQPQPTGQGAGRYHRHRRTYAYNGKEYVSLSALYDDNPEPEPVKPPAKAKARIEPPKKETPQLDALMERLAQPKDDSQARIDALQAQLSELAGRIGQEQARARIDRELFRAYREQAQQAETYRQQMEDLHRQALEIRIGQMQQQDADDEKAILAILSVVEPDLSAAFAGSE